MVLVGYWPLIEDSGAALDYTPENNQGTVNGATQGEPGVLQQTSYLFDGSTSHVQIPSLSSLFNSSPPVTYTAWVNTTNSTDPMGIITNIGGASTRNGSLLVNNGNVGYYDTTGNQGSTLSVDDGNWHFIGVVDDGTDVHYYADSQTETDSGGSDGWDGGDNWVLGRREAGPDWYFDGNIGEIRAYNHALTDSEMSYLYNVAQSTTYKSSTKIPKEEDVGDERRAQMLARRANDNDATVIGFESGVLKRRAAMYDRRNHGNQT